MLTQSSLCKSGEAVAEVLVVARIVVAAHLRLPCCGSFLRYCCVRRDCSWSDRASAVTAAFEWRKRRFGENRKE